MGKEGEEREGVVAMNTEQLVVVFFKEERYAVRIIVLCEIRVGQSYRTFLPGQFPRGISCCARLSYISCLNAKNPTEPEAYRFKQPTLEYDRISDN